MRIGTLLAVVMAFAATAVDMRAQEKSGVDDLSSFYKLTDTVARAYRSGDANAAARAEELLKASSRYENDWNYGNAVHTGNIVLGRIAFDASDLPEAKRRLLMSVAENSMPYGLKDKNRPDGASKASPQMDSFGPDMSLARDLLTKGETETVLKYFDLCSRFWDTGKDRLAKWRTQIENGETPNFGPNLAYVIK